MLKTPNLSIRQWIVVIYLTLIFIGGGLLMLPLSTKAGLSTHFIDALFTATSALCVTGQVTLNTAEHWSRFGQVIIITLIEIGGLGFMTFWVSAFVLLGQRPDLVQRKLARDFLSISNEHSLLETIGYILSFSLIVQSIGAILLSFILVPDYGWGEGLFMSVFHSISAFCNAGFDLFGNSLVNYTDQPLVILTIAGLIMTGGLGYLVWYEILNYHKTKKLHPYSRIILITTSSIWLISTILFAINESHGGAFSDLSLPHRWMNYLFLAVTPRTAGYANIDYQLLTHPSILLTCVLMFIGGSPGSTAGGIKVSTLATFFIDFFRDLQGKPNVVFKRSIDNDTVKDAFFIILTAGMVVIIALYLLLMTQTIPEGFGIEYALIEVTSCLGTVGLTLGMTPHLTTFGKIVLIALMFIGRIGLSTFYWSFSMRRHRSNLHYPKLPMMLG